MKKPKDGWPMLFGVDHYGGGGKGMEEKLAAIVQPGTRCFIECNSGDTTLYNKGAQLLLHLLPMDRPIIN